MHNLILYLTGRKQFLRKIDIERWQFQPQVLMRYIADSLGLEQQYEEIQPDVLYQIGKYKVQGTTIPIYLINQSLDQGTKILEKLGKNKNIAILWNGDTKVIAETDSQLPVISILDVMGADKKGLTIDPMPFGILIQEKIVRVTFNSVNGDLRLDGNLLVNLQPTSPPYNFVHCLYGRLNTPVSHEDAYDFYKNEQIKLQNIEPANWNDEYNPQTFCNTMKGRVKTAAQKISQDNANTIDALIVVSKTQDGKNAYMLRSLL